MTRAQRTMLNVMDGFCTHATYHTALTLAAARWGVGLNAALVGKTTELLHRMEAAGLVECTHQKGERYWRPKRAAT